MAEPIINSAGCAEKRTEVEVEGLPFAEGPLLMVNHLVQEKLCFPELLVDISSVHHRCRVLLSLVLPQT